MADAMRRKGDIERAMTEARISLNLRPDDPDTHVVLGMALMTKGQVDEAAVHFSKAVEIRPNHSTAHYNLAIALLEKHETGKAIEQYEKAIEVQPDFLEALTNLSWIFANYPEATIRNPPKAVELAEKANQLAGGADPLVLRTLAAAYASNRSFDKALETSRRALQYAQEQHNFEAAEAIRREMSLYEVGQQPYQTH
jgi:Flp pilus assembly protein TadD